MFNKPIDSELKVLSQDFQDYFCKKIRGYVRINGDKSLEAVGRLVLFPRIGDDECIYFSHKNTGCGKEVILNNSLSFSVSALTDPNRGKLNKNRLNCINIATLYSEEEYALNFETIRKGFSEYFTDYVELIDVEEYLRPCMTVLIYINDKKQDTYIFVRELNPKRLHFLLSLMPRFLPWYFKDNPLDDDEIALFKSLTCRCSPEFVHICNKMTEERFDLREIFLRQKLDGFGNSYYIDRIKKIQFDQNVCRNSMISAETNYAREAKKLQDLIIMEAGIRESMLNGKQENIVLNYLLCNKSVDVIDASKHAVLKFIVRTFIANWDPEQANILLTKQTSKSAFFRDYNRNFLKFYETQMPDKRIEKLVKALFIDETLKLRVCAAYSLDFASKTFAGHSHYMYGLNYKSYTPNQHIHQYACLGNNVPEIRRAVTNSDYIMAIESCIASAQNINMLEPNTVSYFMKEILNPEAGQIIQMPDGTTKTPTDAVEWIEAQEAGTEHIKEAEKE